MENNSIIVPQDAFVQHVFEQTKAMVKMLKENLSILESSVHGEWTVNHTKISIARSHIRSLEKTLDDISDNFTDV